MSYLSYVQARGFNRTSKEIAVDLINYFNKFDLPADIFTFGVPKFLDQRPEVGDDPDTFVPGEIDELYSYNYPGLNGFLYHRLDISVLLQGKVLVVNPPGPVYKVHDVLGQINYQLGSKLSPDDLENDTYDIGQPVITLRVSEKSLAWYGVETANVIQETVAVYVRVTQNGSLRRTEEGLTRSI